MFGAGGETSAEMRGVLAREEGAGVSKRMEAGNPDTEDIKRNAKGSWEASSLQK